MYINRMLGGMSMILFCCILFFSSVYAATRYISDEQAGRVGTGTASQQEQAAREIVDDQDTLWKLSLASTDTMYQASFGTGDDQALGSIPYVFSFSGTDIASLSRVQLISSGIGQVNGTATQPLLDASDTLQDSAPFPSSLYGERFRNEKLGGSGSQRNAARFEIFSGVVLEAFGVWVGDLETRTDGEGWPAEIALYDTDENLIDMIVIAPSTGNQAGCGGALPSESPSDCGNETTRWVGVSLTDTESEQLHYIVISVGDDDSSAEGESADGTTEHLSLLGPTFVFACHDTDNDTVCDIEDVCPDDPVKYESSGACGCGIVEPENIGITCFSTENSCGSFGTGTIQCDGSCSATIPDVPVSLGTMCLSDSNVCGDYATGTILCDGSCSVKEPGLPDMYDNLCTSIENNCGHVHTGTIQCDGICSAIAPDDLVDCSCPFPVSDFGDVCASSQNVCGQVATGTILCDGTCSVTTPDTPLGYGDICSSSSNSCGMVSTGSIDCGGVCDVSIPSDALCDTGNTQSSVGGSSVGSTLIYAKDINSSKENDQTNISTKKDLPVEIETFISKEEKIEEDLVLLTGLYHSIRNNNTLSSHGYSGSIEQEGIILPQTLASTGGKDMSSFTSFLVSGYSKVLFLVLSLYVSIVY